MYNRYVPNADGTYQRQIMRSAPSVKQPPVSDTPQPPPAKAEACTESSSAPALPIRLPMETEDILVLLVLLLILMQESESNRMTALVTIAAFILLQ